ncbi:hypothetical protein EYF80_025950 [Liparis tanakae]|uniref:Uncharacterized protein n=1 Tax=Liparis tanakae TaxID=230148 RepID=A0A4Z2HG78_9TELE|nr:hypothetical protein EYF80_025950 [Liparis tanakae]
MQRCQHAAFRYRFHCYYCGVLFDVLMEYFFEGIKDFSPMVKDKGHVRESLPNLKVEAEEVQKHKIILERYPMLKVSPKLDSQQPSRFSQDRQDKISGAKNTDVCGFSFLRQVELSPAEILSATGDSTGGAGWFTKQMAYHPLYLVSNPHDPGVCFPPSSRPTRVRCWETHHPPQQTKKNNNLRVVGKAPCAQLTWPKIHKATDNKSVNPWAGRCIFTAGADAAMWERERKHSAPTAGRWGRQSVRQTRFTVEDWRRGAWLH